jgi:hypothetical protein
MAWPVRDPWGSLDSFAYRRKELLDVLRAFSRPSGVTSLKRQRLEELASRYPRITCTCGFREPDVDDGPGERLDFGRRAVFS